VLPYRWKSTSRMFNFGPSLTREAPERAEREQQPARTVPEGQKQQSKVVKLVAACVIIHLLTSAGFKLKSNQRG
jgi:hypothetical protein